MATTHPAGMQAASAMSDQVPPSLNTPPSRLAGEGGGEGARPLPAALLVPLSPVRERAGVRGDIHCPWRPAGG